MEDFNQLIGRVVVARLFKLCQTNRRLFVKRERYQQILKTSMIRTMFFHTGLTNDNLLLLRSGRSPF